MILLPTLSRLTIGVLWAAGRLHRLVGEPAYGWAAYHPETAIHGSN